MHIYLISRHAGAIEWMNHMGYHYDTHLTHLERSDLLVDGDVVIGSLPINIVADLNARGITYMHLSLCIPEALPGCELSADQLSALDAKLEIYYVTHGASICIDH